MSDQPPRPVSAEARWLRENWSRDRLGQYEGTWIAVLGEEVAASDRDMGSLLQRMSRLDPLYAFVWFGAL